MRTWIVCAAATLALTGCPDDGSNAEDVGQTGGATGTTGSDDGGTAVASTGIADSDGGSTTDPAADSTAAVDASTAADTAATTGSTGAECELGTQDCACDGGTCQGNLACVGDVCVPPGVCDEHPEGEPNDTEANAVVLGEVPGCMVAEVAGAVDADDSDWFVYHGTVDPLCAQDTTGIVEADPDLTVCMFWECDQGNEQIVCFGMPEAVSPDGRPGCCGSAGNVVFMQRECLGVGDQPDGTVYLEVRGPDDAMCVDYSLAYLF